jgi:ketosteroid isomerase-like protein
MTNKEIAQKGYECFGTGDIAGLLELCANDIDWTIPVVENASFSGSRSGKAAVGEFFNQLAAAEDFSDFTPKEFIAEGDKVVVLGSSTATVKETGKTFSTDWVHIFTIADGRITNFLEFFDNAGATRAYQKTAAA